MNPMQTLVKALLTGFGWRLGSEVATAISNRMQGRKNPPPAATDDDDEDDEPGEVHRP